MKIGEKFFTFLIIAFIAIAFGRCDSYSMKAFSLFLAGIEGYIFIDMLSELREIVKETINILYKRHVHNKFMNNDE